MVVMLDTPCSEVECKTTGYTLHSHVPFSLPLMCVTVCHQVSTELYYIRKLAAIYIAGRSGVPRYFVRGGSTNSIEDRGQRERGSGGSSPLFRGIGSSCNLVKEISFHIVKFS